MYVRKISFMMNSKEDINMQKKQVEIELDKSAVSQTKESKKEVAKAKAQGCFG